MPHCRANKGSPGIDGQDFADIEAYGVERWLAELALGLRPQTYRPEPIRRVYIPKANGELRPLGISSVQKSASKIGSRPVLPPSFRPDLPRTIRPSRIPLESRVCDGASWCARCRLTAWSELTASAYSVPWRRIGESVQVAVAGEQLRISHAGRGTARCPPVPINNGNWRDRELDFFEPRYTRSAVVAPTGTSGSYSAAAGCARGTGGPSARISASHGPGKRPRPTLSREKMW